MPIGSYAVIPYIAQHLLQYRPQSVLDLGIGSGGNGSAVREWLDAGVQPWTTFLAGVEVWADYRNPVWDLYNLIVVNTIQNYLARCRDQFDLILLTDVIEHFELSSGKDLLRSLTRLVAPNGGILVSTPAAFMHQGAEHGNTYERHLSSWSEQDFQKFGYHTQIVGSASWYCGQAIVAEWRST